METQAIDTTDYQNCQIPATRQKGITIDDIVSLKVANPGLTTAQAAKILDCAERTVWWHLQKHDYTWNAINNTVDNFRKAESKLLSWKQRMALETITPDALQKQSALQNSTVYCQLKDKQRLIDGESTANVAYKDIEDNEAELAEKRAALQALLLKADK